MLNFKFPLVIEFFKWKIYDLFKFFKYGRKIHLYGIKMYCGLYGMGKTMALTKYLYDMRCKYGDSIYIATNYFFEGQDFAITSWRDLLVERDKPIIFGYDEIQNEFNSRDYNNFPYELLTLLTQNRKGHGKQIVCTAQRFCRVDKIFRELCQEVIECKTILSRYTVLRHYDLEDYEMLLKTSNVNNKIKIRCFFKERFVQTDKLRNMYDSYKMLDSAKSKEYISKQERSFSFLDISVD
ncbi:hypothetical protein AN642_00735 [Epulopiscium sp. SCG-B10WGA-EpuloA2]|nr:hypothetical protein AN642_00735 [Epulopiscium sp. SCG-B10WGA-EpuloA2]